MVGAMPEALVREANGLATGNGYVVDGKQQHLQVPPKQRASAGAEGEWFEEAIDDDLKLCYALNGVLYHGASKYQEIALIDTKHFGKALIIDGKMQSTEADEFIYHESLIHPPLLFHPKHVFMFFKNHLDTSREAGSWKTVESDVFVQPGYAGSFA